MEKFESNFKDLKDGLDQNEFQGKESVIMINEPFQSMVFKVQLYFIKMCPIFVGLCWWFDQNFKYFLSVDTLQRPGFKKQKITENYSRLLA